MTNSFKKRPGKAEIVWVTCPSCKGGGIKDGITCTRCGGKGQIRSR